MDFEGKGLAIIGRFAFVLLNAGGPKIRGYVFARTDYLMKVLEYKTCYRISLENYIWIGMRHTCLNYFFFFPFFPLLCIFFFCFSFSPPPPNSQPSPLNWLVVSVLNPGVQSNVPGQCNEEMTGIPTCVTPKSEWASSKQCPFAPHS